MLIIVDDRVEDLDRIKMIDDQHGVTISIPTIMIG